MNNVIELRNVTVSFRGHAALRDVSLSVRAGAFVAVLGPNGAGKTTLLTIINGIGRIETGSVRIFDTMLPRGLSGIQKEIGYIPQHFRSDPSVPVRVREAVALGRYGKIGLFRRPGREDERITREAMELTGIMHLADTPVGMLSGGEQQKVAIARALAQEPKIMLFDEPTASLDLRAQFELLRLVEMIYARRGCTMMFVTHALGHIPGCCTDAVLVKGGTVTFAGPAQAALTEPMLTELYGCPIQVTEADGKRHFHAGCAHV